MNENKVIKKMVVPSVIGLAGAIGAIASCAMGCPKACLACVGMECVGLLLADTVLYYAARDNMPA